MARMSSLGGNLTGKGEKQAKKKVYLMNAADVKKKLKNIFSQGTNQGPRKGQRDATENLGPHTEVCSSLPLFCNGYENALGLLSMSAS